MTGRGSLCVAGLPAAIFGPKVGASSVLRYNTRFTTKWAGIHRPFFLVVLFWSPCDAGRDPRCPGQ
jgi:hypothetical protein